MSTNSKKDEKNFLLLVVIGLVAGVINGLFGAGSGLILIPVISAFTDKKDKVAHATTLSCVMLMCIVSATIYMVNGQVKYDVILWCAIGSVIGSVLGTVLLQKFKNKIINLIFSSILIVAGVLMIIL